MKKINFFQIIIITIILKTIENKETIQNTYLGSYSNEILSYKYINQSEFRLTRKTPVNNYENPSWLSTSGNKKFLFSVGEVNSFEGKYSGSISSFLINQDYSITRINSISSNGGSPCHLKVHKNTIFISNYCSGSLSLVNHDENGYLKTIQVINHTNEVDKECIKGSHVHQTVIEENNVFVVDLGLNSIFHYTLQEDNTIRPNIHSALIKLEEGCGPRQMIITKKGYAYVLCELSSRIMILKYDEQKGVLRRTQYESKTTLRNGESNNRMAASEMKIKEEKYIYVSNRDLSNPNQNRNSIGVFEISKNEPIFEIIQHVNTEGVHPRYFTFDKFDENILVSNKNTGNIVIFGYNKTNGLIDKNQFNNFIGFVQPTFILFL
jgi:6-phosphogluconolactonase